MNGCIIPEENEKSINPQQENAIFLVMGDEAYTDEMIDEYNRNAEAKTEEFNTNATNKLNAFNENATTKTNTFNTNATTQTDTYNSNAATKLSEYNDNAAVKEQSYNSNADTKTQAFNQNAAQKEYEFNQNALAYQEGIEKNAEEIDEVSNRVYRIENNLYDSGTAEGDFINIEDSSYSEFQNVTVDGASEQETTTGKNLLPYPYVDTTKTENGITFTDNGDGTITVNGTATAGVFFKVFATQINQEEIPGNYISGSAIGCNIVVAHKQESTYTSLGISSGGNSSHINKDTYIDGYIELSILQGATLNNVIVRPMLTLEQDTTYEPYTGGEPSPSPDYPQPIEVIKEDFNITSCGKNLYYGTSDSYSFTSNKASWYFVNGDNGANGTNVGNRTLYKGLVKEGETYTFKANINGTIGNMALIYDDESNIYGSSTIWDEYTFTAKKDGYVLLRLWINSPANIEVSNVQLEQGSQATEYEPYQGTTTTIALPEGQFAAKISDAVKDQFRIAYNESDGNYHLYLDKNVGKVVLDGSEDENWMTATEGNTINGFSTYLLLNDIITSTPNKQFLCDRLQALLHSYVMSSSPINFVCGGYGNIVIININRTLLAEETIAGIKQWLQSNNVIVYYQLKTTQTIDIGKVQMPLTYYPVTNVFTDCPLLPTIEVAYYRDFKTTIETMQEDIASNTSRIETLEEQIQSQATTISNLENRITALEPPQTESEVVEQ